MTKEKLGYYCTRCGHWHRPYTVISKSHTLWAILSLTQSQKDQLRRRAK